MPNLNYVFPFFIVEHLQPSVAFYVDKLGFEVQHIGPADDPYWAIVGRDNVWIMLKAITPEIKPVPNHTRHPWAAWDAFISTTDPDALFEEYRSRGLTFRQPIMDNHDGLRGFELADADGYVLFFGRPVASFTSVIKTISPLLLVADVEQSITFYAKLGFSVDFRYEDFYAGILRDGHSIHLKVGTSTKGKNKDDLDINVAVGGIERLYEEALSKSVNIIQPLREMPYGKEFYIADPDGNLIGFVE